MAYICLTWSRDQRNIFTWEIELESLHIAETENCDKPVGLEALEEIIELRGFNVLQARFNTHGFLDFHFVLRAGK